MHGFCLNWPCPETRCKSRVSYDTRVKCQVSFRIHLSYSLIFIRNCNSIVCEFPWKYFKERIFTNSSQSRPNDTDTLEWELQQNEGASRLWLLLRVSTRSMVSRGFMWCFSIACEHWNVAYFCCFIVRYGGERGWTMMVRLLASVPLSIYRENMGSRLESNRQSIFHLVNSNSIVYTVYKN